MATKSTKKTTKQPQSQSNLKDKINDLVEEMELTLEDVRDDWDRYFSDGVKKGFKEARKSVLKIKKAAGEIRKTMGNVSL